MPGDVFDCGLWGKGGEVVPPALGGRRPGMLLHFLGCSGRPLKTRVHSSISSVRVTRPVLRPKADFSIDRGALLASESFPWKPCNGSQFILQRDLSSLLTISPAHLLSLYSKAECCAGLQATPVEAKEEVLALRDLAF